MVATPKKKTSGNKAKKARKPPRARSAKAASKKRARKSKRVVKKTKKVAKKAARKPVAKKAARKSAGKAAKKTKSQKRVSAPEPTRLPKKSRKPKPVTASKTAAAAKPAPASPRGNTYYITTAIAYPNGVPHIGHAYEAIATDALARFARLDGKDVFFLTGTDEHGLKMIQTAEAEKLPTLEVATRNALRFKEMDERLNVSFDRFIRTTEEQHHRSSQEIWQRMAANGDIYLDSYAGWYSVRDEAYYAEDEPSWARTTYGAGRRARRSNGSRRRVISSNCPPIRTSCWRSTPVSRISLAPTRARTKSSASSKVDCEIFRFREPPSTGASRSPVIPTM